MSSLDLTFDVLKKYLCIIYCFILCCFYYLKSIVLTSNQIDHIIINGKWRRSLQDVRVCRGADIYSDHYLVTARLKLKLHKVVPESQRRKQLVTRLACPVTKQEFVLELRNRFNALTDTSEETDHDATNKWDTIKKTYVEVATKVLGHKKKNHKEWLTTET